MLQYLKIANLCLASPGWRRRWLPSRCSRCRRRADKKPIKIGFSMAQTGPLAPNGKQALLGMKIWEEETNAKGGLLGRPVKLVYYDDQSNPSTVPGIYTKLLDVDKVDLVIGAYATNMFAPAMPVIIQKKKVFIGLFALAVNSEFNYPNYFSMIPTGPKTKASFTEGFFDTVAWRRIRSRRRSRSWPPMPNSRSNACDGARENVKKFGLKIVYDKTYPPRRPTSRRSCARSRRPIPTSSCICSYPLDSVGMVQAINEPATSRR